MVQTDEVSAYLFLGERDKLINREDQTVKKMTGLV